MKNQNLGLRICEINKAFDAFKRASEALSNGFLQLDKDAKCFAKSMTVVTKATCAGDAGKQSKSPINTLT